MKKIKSNFIKHIQKQKKIKLQLFHKENIKLKKGEKTNSKLISRDEHNKLIEEKEKIIIEFFDNKINEIDKLSCTDFIINYLNKENKNNIMNLMNTNLIKNLALTDISTNISTNIEDLEVNEDLGIKNRIDRIFERGKQNRVKNYIDCDLKINNYFPYKQKKLRKDNEKEKINEIKIENKEIFDVLKELTKLNEEIKEYEKENKEKNAKIKIEMKEEEFDDENFGEVSEKDKESENESEINMEIE